MCCSHFVTGVKAGNLLLIKILKELEGFFLNIMFCTNTVEARKDGMIHLAKRDAARSDMSGKTNRKKSKDQIYCQMQGAAAWVRQEMCLSTVP